MPELPEVEDARQDLEDFVVGKTVARVAPANDEKVIEGVAPADLAAALEGLTATAAGRKGKNCWLEFGGGGCALLIHLGMDGELLVRAPDGAMLRDYKYRAVAKKGAGGPAWPPSHCKILIEFSDGSALAFDEWRRFGRLRLAHGDPRLAPPVCNLGFDALTELPPLPEFRAALLPARARGKLKALLLDQGFSAGVGNWVADEILYMARLHPEQIVGDMGDEHIARLHAAFRDVLQFAVGVRADASKYPPSWLFHSRWTDKKAGRHEGRHMAILTVGGRTSAYVPELQKLVRGGGGGSSSKAAAGGKAAGAGGKAAAGASGKAAAGGKPKAAGKRPRKEEAEEEDDDDGGSGANGGEDGGSGKPSKATKPRRAPSKATATGGAKKGSGSDGGGDPEPTGAARRQRAKSAPAAVAPKSEAAGSTRGRKAGKPAAAAGAAAADGRAATRRKAG